MKGGGSTITPRPLIHKIYPELEPLAIYNLEIKLLLFKFIIIAFNVSYDQIRDYIQELLFQN